MSIESPYGDTPNMQQHDLYDNQLCDTATVHPTMTQLSRIFAHW